MKTCSHCTRVVEDNYCSFCGQKYLKIPFSFKSALDWVADSFDFKRGFFITLIHLLIKPNTVIVTYLGANTKVYVSPLKYLFLILAPVFFISNMTSNPDEEYVPYVVSLGIILLFWLENLLFFRENKFNSAEHLLIVIYESTVFMILSLAAILGLAIFKKLEIVNDENSNGWLVIIWFFLMLIYHLWFSLAVFSGNRLLVGVKSLIVFVLALIIGVSAVGYIRSLLQS